MYELVKAGVVDTVIDAVRRLAPVRSLLLISVALAIAVGGCATPPFEERLSYLDLLKSRGTITEDEYAIMRRRLVETVDPESLRARPDIPALPTEPERASEPLSTKWVVGSWSGAHTGDGNWNWDVVTIVEFSLAGDDLEWTMTRRFRTSLGVSVARASGTAVMREGRLEMTGTYIDGSDKFTDGAPVGYSFQRAGDRLEGLGSGDPRTLTLSLQRMAAPAPPGIPPEPGSLEGVWTGTLHVARRSTGSIIQDNPATLRIFAEASGLRWTLESSYYGEELTGSDTLIISGDQMKLVGSYYATSGAAAGVIATAAQDIPIEYAAHLSGNTLRGSGWGLDNVS